MGPKGPPLASTREPARSIAPRQCQCMADRPLPGHGHLAGRRRNLCWTNPVPGRPARPDLPTYL